MTSATVLTAAGQPPPTQTMCEHCARADVDCLVYPADTVTCVEFLPDGDELREAWERWLAAVSPLEQPALWRALVALCAKAVE